MGLIIDLQPGYGRALVIGGGEIAARKVRTLVEAEFETIVIAPEILDEIRHRPWVTVHERAFEPADLTSMGAIAAVFACTNDRAVNRQIGELARAAHIPVNVTDESEESTFYSPAVLREGELAVAVSTGGASPATAKAVRERIASALGPSWGAIRTTIQADQRRRKDDPTRPSLIIAAHGSHLSAEASTPAWAHRKALLATGNWRRVACAFWKEEPSLARALDSIPTGVVVVAPFFIAWGYFVQQVIPTELGNGARSGHELRFASPLGDHPGLAAIAAQRAREAGAQPGDAIAILGHGTPRHADSERNTIRQANLLRERGEFAEVVAVFLEQEPNMARVFELTKARRVVVVPLFVADGWHAGDSIPQALAGGARDDGRQVIYAAAVGTHPDVANLLEELASDALRSA